MIENKQLCQEIFSIKEIKLFYEKPSFPFVYGILIANAAFFYYLTMNYFLIIVIFSVSLFIYDCNDQVKLNINKLTPMKYNMINSYLFERAQNKAPVTNILIIERKNNNLAVIIILI